VGCVANVKSAPLALPLRAVAAAIPLGAAGGGAVRRAEALTQLLRLGLFRLCDFRLRWCCLLVWLAAAARRRRSKFLLRFVYDGDRPGEVRFRFRRDALAELFAQMAGAHLFDRAFGNVAELERPE